MRVRRTTLADGRYLIFYEFVQSEPLDSISEDAQGELDSLLTEKKEASV